MAVIGQIRKHSGLIITVVGIALAAFVLGDFLKPRTNTRQSNIIGEVNGEEILVTEFNSNVQESIEATKQNQNKQNLTQEEIFSIKQRVWNQTVEELIMSEEYQEIGLNVSGAELHELVQGAEPHRYILQYFKDPQTNQYDPSLVREYISRLQEMDPSNRRQWETFLEAILEDRMKTKYQNLLKNGYFIPSSYAQSYDQLKERKAKARFVAARFEKVPDSLVNVTEDDVKEYYEDYKYKYEQDYSRDFDYVIFNVVPSATDSADIASEVADIFSEFKEIDAGRVPSFVNYTSDTPYDSSYVSEGELPVEMDSIMFNSEPGAMIEPYVKDGAYHMARLMATTFRPDSMKASHILISFQGALRAPETVTRSKDEAEKIADSLLNVIENNNNRFEEIAKNMSDGPTGRDGGDLGWFADGAMAPNFNEAVVENEVGTITTAETQFGYHIIKVTGKKELKKKIRVARIERAIEPGKETYQDYFTKASTFSTKNSTYEKFDQAVNEQGLNKRSATRIGPMTNRIAGLDYPRSIIHWVFHERTNVGDVSPVFDLGDVYVVAALTKIHEEGTTPLDEMRDQLEILITKDKKAEVLVDRLKKASSKYESVETIAEKYDLVADTLESISFASRAIPGFGMEPEVLGKIFTLKPNQLSKPIKGNSAVYIFYVDEFIEPSEKADYEATKNQLKNLMVSRVNNNNFFEAIKEKAEIEDNRVLFY